MSNLKRIAAHDQLPGCLGDLIGKALLPLIQYLQFIYLEPASGPECADTMVSAHLGPGSSSTTKAGLVSPEYIPAPPIYLTDTAPVERWNYDILTDEGETELRRIQVVQVITTECAQLPQQGEQAAIFQYRHVGGGGRRQILSCYVHVLYLLQHGSQAYWLPFGASAAGVEKRKAVWTL